jgi:MFS family permease
MPASRFTLYTLIVVVAIAGLSQGLTLPLLAVLLEKQGVSSVANGVNAAALYIGILAVSPWLEIPLRRLGYRTTLLIGLALMTLATILLPLSHHLLLWFVWRMLLGIGDSALHFSSQLWVTAIAPPDRRGRDISMYGLAYGIGFSAGPLGLNLLPFGAWAPFAALLTAYAIAFLLLARLKNAYPEESSRSSAGKNKYARVFRFGWWALLPSFLYGYMEASLNASFPVYALRVGLSVESVSIILPAFVIGSILLQLPIGSLSDRIGRKKVMSVCAGIGAIAFLLFPLADQSVWLMMLTLAAAGAAVGSFYSLGLAYAADILPSSLMPTVGVIAAMNFSVASILGPNLNGYVLDHLPPGLIFTLIGALLGLFVLAGVLFRERPGGEERGGTLTASMDPSQLS